MAAGSSAKIAVSVAMPEDITPEFVAYFGQVGWVEGQWKCTITPGSAAAEAVTTTFTSKCLVLPTKASDAEKEEGEAEAAAAKESAPVGDAEAT